MSLIYMWLGAGVQHRVAERLIACAAALPVGAISQLHLAYFLGKLESSTAPRRQVRYCIRLSGALRV